MQRNKNQKRDEFIMKQIVKLTKEGKKEQERLNARYINRISKSCVRCKELIDDETIFSQFCCENCSDWVNLAQYNTTMLRSITRQIMLKESSDIKDTTKAVMQMNRESIVKFLTKKKLVKHVNRSYYYVGQGRMK